MFRNPTPRTPKLKTRTLIAWSGVSGVAASGIKFAQSQCTTAADIKSQEISQLGQRRGGSCRELDHAMRLAQECRVCVQFRVRLSTYQPTPFTGMVACSRAEMANGKCPFQRWCP